jgi:hypothetical protein
MAKEKILGEYRSVFGYSVKITQPGLDHILNRHPELRTFDFIEKLELTISDPDYVVEGKANRHMAVRLHTEIKGTAKHLVSIYEEGGEVITSFITSRLDRVIRRKILWKRY